MASTLRPELLRQYAGGCATFIETGTAKGDGTQVAIDQEAAWHMDGRHFRSIITIEANPDVFAEASMRFAGEPRVLCVHGDAGQALPNILKGTQDRICFWLDSHWSTGEPTLPGVSPCPILAELNAIRECSLRNDHVIMVDDIRYFWTGLDQWKGVTVSQIVENIMLINPRYWITFVKGVTENDILIATMWPR